MIHYRVTVLAAALFTLSRRPEGFTPRSTTTSTSSENSDESFSRSPAPRRPRRFEHALAGLHSFWFEEGSRAFGAVLEADPRCAMAHWGLALNAWGNPFAGGPSGDALLKAAREAELASARPAGSAREQGFISATAALYRNTADVSNALRLQAYADTMARLYREHPRISRSPSITPWRSSLRPRAPTRLSPNRSGPSPFSIRSTLVIPTIPAWRTTSSTQPTLHGWRHWASKPPGGMPASPLLRRMLSTCRHIFSCDSGSGTRAVATNWKSYNSGVAHARATGPWTTSAKEIHALDYAVYGYLQRGQDSAARAAVAMAQAAKVSRPSTC